jgi:serine/threonine-protein kinase
VSPGGPAPASPTTAEGGTPRSSTASTASAAPQGKKLTSKGGSVYASCAGGRAKLNSWNPAPGYSVEKVNQGPALAAVIVFKGSSGKYRMTVTCVAGDPTVVVLPL